MDSKQLAKIKLKEFHRWRRVASIEYGLISISSDWYLTLSGVDYNRDDGLLTWWQREAPCETNEIIKGVNGVPNVRQRAILIMTYILPMRAKNKEQIDTLGIKTSTYPLAKSNALISFAKSYRDGELETLSD